MTTSREIQWMRASEQARALLLPRQRQFIERAKIERERQKTLAQIRAAQWISETFPSKQPRRKLRKRIRSTLSTA